MLQIMKTLRIDLPQEREAGYNIIIGEHLLKEAGSHIKPHLANNRTIILSDENTAKLYLSDLQKSLDSAGITHDCLVFAGGEQAKSMTQYEALIDDLFTKNIERQTTLIALGGGIVGDLCGFLAATIMRGIPFIQIPTTLLAQVDSAVGGKTGINTKAGKNMVGAFHQPLLVLTDISLLQSLPIRHLRAGYAEIVKYALIQDKAFFDWLEEHGESIVSNPPDTSALAYAIEHSCTHKADIVAKDTQEHGVRALLNLGHTFAHALEACREHDDQLLHGEAVAIGLDLAFRLSHKLGHCDSSEVKRVQSHLHKTGLQISHAELLPHIDKSVLPELLIQKMQFDKKVQNSKLRLILAKKIGASFIAEGIPTEAILATITDYLHNS